VNTLITGHTPGIQKLQGAQDCNIRGWKPPEVGIPSGLNTLMLEHPGVEIRHDWKTLAVENPGDEIAWE